MAVIVENEETYYSSDIVMESNLKGFFKLGKQRSIFLNKKVTIDKETDCLFFYLKKDQWIKTTCAYTKATVFFKETWLTLNKFVLVEDAKPKVEVKVEDVKPKVEVKVEDVKPKVEVKVEDVKPNVDVPEIKEENDRFISICDKYEKLLKQIKKSDDEIETVKLQWDNLKTLWDNGKYNNHLKKMVKTSKLITLMLENTTDIYSQLLYLSDEMIEFAYGEENINYSENITSKLWVDWKIVNDEIEKWTKIYRLFSQKLKDWKEEKRQEKKEEQYSNYHKKLRVYCYYKDMRIPVSEDTDWDILNMFDIEYPTFNDVKKAYRKMSLIFHPDKYDGDDPKIAEEAMKLINRAYETLKNLLDQ